MSGNRIHKGRASAPSCALRLQGVSKSFGQVVANRDVTLEVQAGTIHGIVGENGAGKSTLMNIIYGLHAADNGQIEVFGKQADIRSSADAIGLGIGMVHQHFMLVPNMSVLDNVMLGTEGSYLLKSGRTDTLETLSRLADEYGMKVDPHANVEDLPVGIRQRVEIIKALKGGARILIMDEPTGVLAPGEADKLFEILRSLKNDGVTVLLITHKLDEIMRVTDAVSVMRDGEMVAHRKTRDTSPGELARIMVGREVLLRVDRGVSNPGEILLAANGLGCTSKDGSRLLEGVDIELRSGEILGVAGVSGNGQTELLEILSGMRVPDEGSVTVFADVFSGDRPAAPSGIRSLGVAHIPEDRHLHGLVLTFEARENAILGFQQNESFYGRVFARAGQIDNHCRKLMQDHDVRPCDPFLNARNFSGGNQQKLVIGREVHAEPKVLLVGQPTRGVDIGAIEFIHKQLIELRDQGCAILLVSVELEEVLGLSDRIMVMNAGKCVGVVERGKADEETIGLMMAGIEDGKAA